MVVLITPVYYLVSVSLPSRGEPKPPAPPISPPGPANRQSCSEVRPSPGPGPLALGLSPNTEEVTESLLRLCLPGEPRPGMVPLYGSLMSGIFWGEDGGGTRSPIANMEAA